MSSICSYSKLSLPSPIKEENNIDFRCKTVAIVGSSGCGKTTWINNFINSKPSTISNKKYYSPCNIITSKGIFGDQKVYYNCNFIESSLENLNLEEVDAVFIFIDSETGYDNKDMSKVRQWVKTVYSKYEGGPYLSITFTKNDKHNIKCRPIIIKSFAISLQQFISKVVVNSINNYNGLMHQVPLKHYFEADLNTKLLTIYKNTN